MFYFHPDPWGDDPIWRANIFQMGWFNHHLERQQFLYMFFNVQAFWAGSIWCIWMANFFDSSLVLTGIPKEESGQIIATSHNLTPNGGLVREIPLFQENLGWWNMIPFGQKNGIFTWRNCPQMASQWFDPRKAGGISAYFLQPFGHRRCPWRARESGIPRNQFSNKFHDFFLKSGKQ